MTYKSNAQVDNLGGRELATFYAEHLRLGWHPKTTDGCYVLDKDRFSGARIIGKQGGGKSVLIAHMAVQDARQQRPLVLFDPHGDLVDDVAAQLSDEDAKQVSVIDITDETHAPGINPFYVPTRKSTLALVQATDSLMHIFGVLWPDVLNQQYLPTLLRAATITLFANPGSTLIDMLRLLTDQGYRQKMVAHVTDQSVVDFFRDFDAQSDTAKRQQAAPLVNRLQSLMMARPIIRNILGQVESTIDFRRAITNREIILIKLPLKTLKQDAQLIGLLLMSQLYDAVFSFADTPEAQRPGVSIYIDEFQNFVTKDIAELFTEGRKYKSRLVVCHQQLGQLPDYLQEACATARTHIVFQPTPDDARSLAAFFPNAASGGRTEITDHKVVEWLLQHETNDRVVAIFVATYLAALQRQPKKDGYIEIKKPGARADVLVGAFLQVDAKTLPPVTVADPTTMLNRLLVEVMKTGDADLHIPSEIIAGFANCGRGYYPEFRRANKRHLLWPDIQYPPALVVPTATGTRWTRIPDHGGEQLFHMVYHLRHVMAYLAANPIGSKRTLGTSDVASMMVRLPRRAAFVLSGQEMGVIFTDDKLPVLQGKLLADRLALIQAQTRLRYCKPIPNPNTPPPPPQPDDDPQPRWEVL